MRRADRLIELIACLKTKTVVRADDLATHFEVSVRTIYRDIAVLQAQGLPIDGQAGVGFMLRGDLSLPPIAFDHDEIEALALGLAYVAQVGDPELAAAARSARGKADMAWAGTAVGLMASRPIRASQRPERRSPVFGSLLRAAIRDHHGVQFTYADEVGRETRRSVRPLALIAFSEGWLLGAWCEERRDFRTFRLDRMRDLELGPAFSTEADKDLGAFLNRPGRPLPTP
jgi:predicted DNA-binding transcriptional regulator YafY